MPQKRRVRPDEFSSVTPAAAARFLGVSRQTVYTWLGTSELRSHQVPGFAGQRILIADLERLRRRRAR